MILKHFYFICLCTLGHVTIFAQQTRPNIVLILADDLGYGDPRCYNADSKIPTPNLDRMAREGMRFTDAHSPSSVCTPTRYGILTGRYAWRTRLQKSVLWPWDPPLIEDERLTLPEMLKSLNYQTACIGKWHLGWNWLDKRGSPVRSLVMAGINDLAKQKEMEDSIVFEQPIKGGPIEHGFDYYFGDDVPNFPPYIFIENDYTVGLPTGRKPDDMFGHPGPALPGWDLSGVMPAITQKACSYLDAVNAVENPVFLYLPLTAPHTPIAPSPHFIGKSGAGWYGDYVMEVDWAVGQVIETLERNGLIENTLLIFTSDNGSPQRDGTDMNGETGSVKALGHDPSKPWRGMKSDIWEGGHRIPFIARWPKFLPAASITDQPFILSDLMRTIAGITGYDIPENMAGDSYDFSRLFMGLHTNAPIRNHLIHHSGNGVFAIRIDEWKLILGRDSGGFTKFEPPPDAPDGQLYHLKEDPMEQNNLYTDHPEIVKKLTTELEKIKREERWRQE